MTTIGRGSTATIAAACDDGAVRIYDSVTGVLRLSLRPKLPIGEMMGPADGSLLVCTHTGYPIITLWDIQTGGLVHTFILKGEIKRTAVSLKGRYLACETSENTVNFWETSSRTEYPDPLGKFEGNTPCWMAPEELITVVDRGSVYIRDVIAKGPSVHKFDVLRSAQSVVYSQSFDLLAIISPYILGHSFVIIDIKTGTSSTLHGGGKRLSFVAFSQPTKQLVCGGEAPGLEMVDISTGCWMHFDFPATVTSASTLSNGAVVANVRGSGIQLLSLHQGHASSPQPAPPPLTIYPLDKGRIISIIPATDDRVILLETATMSQVLSIPTRKGAFAATVYTAVLCASLKNKIAVCCTKKGTGCYLQMWEFFHQHPRWTVSMGSFASASSISPACTRLVTFHSGGERGSVNLWDAYEGRLLEHPNIRNPDAPRPLDITFDSEDLFYFHYDTHREPYEILARSPFGDSTVWHSITRREGQPLEGQVSEKRYCLDDGREWVFCGSQRVCWVSPGYIGSTPASHWWAGSSLVMVGQDGMLRKLTLLEPPGKRLLPPVSDSIRADSSRPRPATLGQSIMISLGLQ